MKKIRHLLLFVLAVMSAVCIFSTSKACAYSVEKKNIVTTLKDIDKGVVAILKNKNKYAVGVRATLVFKNGKKEIGSEKEYNFCLEEGKECSLFFLAPKDANCNFKKYNNYKLSFDVYKTSAAVYAVDSIKVSDNCDDKGVTVKVINKGKKKLMNTHLSIIYYDKNKNVIGWDEWFLEFEKRGSKEDITFAYPKGITPDNYKIYVDHAFSYGFEL